MCCLKCLPFKRYRRPYSRSITGGRFAASTPEHEDHIVTPMIQPVFTEASQISARQIEVVEDYAGRKLSISNAFFDKVYYAVLHSNNNGNNNDEEKIAVIKKMDHAGTCSSDDFLGQVSFLSRSKHNNVIELVGYCLEGNLRVLAYKFTRNGSLRDILHGKKGWEVSQPGPVLSWARRLKIAVGAARGLHWLHENNIIHCNVKSSNILLFDDDVAKITKFDVRSQPARAQVANPSCQLLGSFGYQDPTFTATGKFTSESDVYSFGVVLYELLTGHKPNDLSLPREQQSLVRWVKALGRANITQFIDPRLEREYGGIYGAVAEMAAVADSCTTYEPHRRPMMRKVIERLQAINVECCA